MAATATITATTGPATGYAPLRLAEDEDAYSDEHLDDEGDEGEERPRGKGKSTKGVAPGMVWLNYRVTKEERDRLHAWSERNGMAMSKIIRTLLLEAFDEGRDQRRGLPK